MSALTDYFTLAGILPFSIVRAGGVRGMSRRGQRAARDRLTGLAPTLLALAAIDTGFSTLAIRSATQVMQPPG